MTDLAAVKVRIHHTNFALPTESEAVLRCEASGDAPLTVHWKKFDQVIEENEKFLLMSSSLGANQLLDLNISRVESEDSGTYICQAVNAFGSDAAEIQLIIQGKMKPTFPIAVAHFKSSVIKMYTVKTKFKFIS